MSSVADLIASDPMATDEQRGLVERYADSSAFKELAALYANTAMASIDSKQVDQSAPVSRKSGAQLRIVLVRQYQHKSGDEPVLMLTFMVSGKTTNAVVGMERKIDKKTCVTHLVPVNGSWTKSETVALIRCDVKYLFTEADKKEVNSRKTKKMKDVQKNGGVPAGVFPICSGQLYTLSVWGQKTLERDGEPIPPGSELELIGVTATCKYEPGMKVSTASPVLHAESYRIINADDHAGQRFAESCKNSCSTPSIIPATAGMRMPGWPTDMLLPTEELPAGVSADFVESTGEQVVLGIPARPLVFIGSKSNLVIHINETFTEACARASAMPPGMGSFTTITSAAMPSEKEDAYVYKKDEKSDPESHARFSVVVSQTVGGNTYRFLIYITIPSRDAAMMVGTSVFAIQKQAMRALIHGLRGPLCIETKPAANPKCDIPGLEDAQVYTAYVGSIPASLLADTVPVAGFRVSEEWMFIERALKSVPDNKAKQLKVESPYYKVAGVPNENSPLLVLSTTAMGFFDDDSCVRIKKALDVCKTISEKRAAIRDLIPSLTGGLKLLSGRYAYFAVGKYCMTQQVIKHQRELAAADETSLMRANEALMAAGSMSPDWDEDTVQHYQDMITGIPSQGSSIVHYAVPLSAIDGTNTVKRIKRQMAEYEQRSKRPAIEERKSADAADDDGNSNSDSEVVL